MPPKNLRKRRARAITKSRIRKEEVRRRLAGGGAEDAAARLAVFFLLGGGFFFFFLDATAADLRRDLFLAAAIASWNCLEVDSNFRWFCGSDASEPDLSAVILARRSRVSS